eukprot:CCRYP_013897-RA/>CCRYP_013897-RA protein AED:0.14 eAED:0.14 QI:0/-1/0/1/-1/1/1/0/415
MPIPRWATHSASFCLGAALATTASLLVRANSDKERPSSMHAESSSPEVVNKLATANSLGSYDTSLHPIKMMPMLPIRIFQPNPHLLIAFDTRTKNPAFVMERLTSKSVHRHASTPAKANRKNKRFHEEQSLAPYHRSRNQNYRNSGYDRGHLAPAADFVTSDAEMGDTFCLTNVSPQNARLNRGMWLRLEDFVRSVVMEHENDSDTWVITGPLWLPNSVRRNSSGVDEFSYSYDGIGKAPSLVSVPTHFFKVIVVASRPKSGIASTDTDAGGDEPIQLQKFAAFVLPNNQESLRDNDEQDSLVKYVVRITDLEAVSGLEFFPGVLGSFVNSPDDVLPLNKVIADALTDDIRFQKKSGYIKQKQGNEASNALVPLSASEAWSKGRQDKVKQILRDNSPIRFQHLCKGNDTCFKVFS